MAKSPAALPLCCPYFSSWLTPCFFHPWLNLESSSYFSAITAPIISKSGNYLHESYGCLQLCAAYCTYTIPLIPKQLFTMGTIMIAIYGGKTSEHQRGEVTCPGVSQLRRLRTLRPALLTVALDRVDFSFLALPTTPLWLNLLTTLLTVCPELLPGCLVKPQPHYMPHPSSLAPVSFNGATALPVTRTRFLSLAQSTVPAPKMLVPPFLPEHLFLDFLWSTELSKSFPQVFWTN